MTSTRLRNASLSFICVALSACSLEPHYVRTAPPVPPSWPIGDAYLARTEAALPHVDYRTIFRDPKLQAIIATALTNNRDLRIAAANIASARAQYRVERAALLPQVDASARASFGQSATGSGSGTTTGTTTGTGTTTTGTGGNGGVYSNYSVNAGISAFELDLFGRIRSLSNAALAEYFGTEATARATRLSLVAEVASAYLTYASDITLLGIARQTEASAGRSVALTRARLQGGIAPRSDLRQAETVQETARADVASYTSTAAQDVNALRLLVGADVDPALLPTSIDAVDGQLGELPAGLGSDILLRRPDVVQAEYSLRAANARIGAARAAFFPTISLTGLAGLASGGLTSLFTGNAFNWNAGPSLSLPIFDGGANRANLAYARAQQQVALAQYEKTIQTAFQEVSDALARRGTITAELGARQRLVAAAQDNYYLSEQSYRGGVETFLTTLDAQRTLYSAQQGLVTTRLTRADNLVTLYRVLGGDATIGGDPAAARTILPPEGDTRR